MWLRRPCCRSELTRQIRRGVVVCRRYEVLQCSGCSGHVIRQTVKISSVYSPSAANSNVEANQNDELNRSKVQPWNRHVDGSVASVVSWSMAGCGPVSCWEYITLDLLWLFLLHYTKLEASYLFFNNVVASPHSNKHTQTVYRYITYLYYNYNYKFCFSAPYVTAITIRGFGNRVETSNKILYVDVFLI